MLTLATRAPVLLITWTICLQRLLTDERLCQSEALYAFLSPSPEHLKVTRLLLLLLQSGLTATLIMEIVNVLPQLHLNIVLHYS